MVKTLCLLIVDNTSWSTDCSTWLTGQGHAAALASSLRDAELKLNQAAFDLVILDEPLGQSQPDILRRVMSHVPVAIVSADYSRSGYRQAMQGTRVIGYINKRLDQDAFLNELDKILRHANLIPKRGRILIVDNQQSVLQSLKAALEQSLYEVYVAATAEQAIASVEMYGPHVVVVDIRLNDDKDTLDESGFTLIRDLKEQYGHAVRFIGMTGSPVRRTAALATGLAFRFVEKDAEFGKAALIPSIEEAFDDLGINLSLSIEFDGTLSFASLVQLIKSYRGLPEAERTRVTQELEELVRKMFSGYGKVKGYYLAPGRGGSGVALMQPSVGGDAAEFFVMKFGSRSSLSDELRNFNSHVKPFAGRYATQLVDIAGKPIETMHLGGLMFSFVGMSQQKPQDFSSFYRDPATTSHQIGLALTFLIEETCVSWYKYKRDGSDTEADVLARVYEAQLSLDTPEKQRKLSQIVNSLLESPAYHGFALAARGQDSIKFTVEKTQIELPQPLAFLSRYRTKLPKPKYICRTHGDLNGRNMFVDKDARVWLIDFFKTGWGPLLRDLAELETDIKFELMETQNLSALFEFERAVLTPASFDEPIVFDNQFDIAELDKAQAVIGHLRRLAMTVYESSNMKEYYSSLIFYAVKALGWEGMSSFSTKRHPIRQRHALLSAALLAYRIQHYDAFPGWPDQKTVITIP